MMDVRSLRSRPGAAVAAFLWVAGTIVLPAIHLARHARPHDHEGGGIRYHLGEDAGHAHDDHDDHDDDDPGGPFTVEVPHGHGPSHHADGLAHFAAATGEGAAATLVFTSELEPDRAPDAPATRHGAFFLEGREPARGPPPA